MWGEVILICTLEGGAYECVMDGRKRLYSCIEYIVLAVLFHILDYWASIVIEHFYQSHTSRTLVAQRAFFSDIN